MITATTAAKPRSKHVARRNGTLPGIAKPEGKRNPRQGPKGTASTKTAAGKEVVKKG